MDRCLVFIKEIGEGTLIDAVTLSTSFTASGCCNSGLQVSHQLREPQADTGGELRVLLVLSFVASRRF